MGNSQIWYLQDGKVQSQAAKVFLHQRGPLLKFPPSSDSIDNSCLCKYKYMRYFSFYQRVPSDSSSLVFFKDITPDERGIIDYSTSTQRGFNWRKQAGPIYMGCFPNGTFQLGKWMDVELPYSESSDSKSNETVPCPYYIYKTKQPNKSSLRCMIVSSYKCCNGTAGCGIEVPRGSDIVTFDSPVCVQDFFVSNLIEAASRNDTSLANAVPIEGTRQCCVRQYQKKEQLKSCDTALVRVHSLMPYEDCEDHCRDCYEELPGQARSKAVSLARTYKCVYWHLWKWELSNCQCQIEQLKPSEVEDLSEVPAQVVGKGGGLAPLSWHDPQKQFVYCSQTGGTVYQWNYTQEDVEPDPPGPLEQNPCKDACSTNGPSAQISDSLSSKIGKGSDSISRSQLPCNYPDPEGRQYLSFNFQSFNVYYLKVSKVQQSQLGDEQDLCHPAYKIDPQSIQDGRLKWLIYHQNKLDYQLQALGFFKGAQFQYFKNASIGMVCFPWPAGQQPPDDPYDPRLEALHISGDQQLFVQDTSENLCEYLYQVYLVGCKCKDDPCSDQECEQKEPLISSLVCTKWNCKGRVSQQQMERRGLCKDHWQVSTVDNTFSTPQTGPVGELVYTVLSKDPAYCGDHPEAPQKFLWYGIANVSYGCDPDRTPIWQQEVQWELDYVPYAYCVQADQTGLIWGWKAEKNVNAPALPDQYNISPEGCIVYYFEKLQELPQTYDKDGNPIFPDTSSQWLPSRNMNWEACRQKGDTVAFIGSPGCVYQEDQYGGFAQDCTDAGKIDPSQSYSCQTDYYVYLQALDYKAQVPGVQDYDFLYDRGYEVRPFGIEPYYYYGQLRYTFYSPNWQCYPQILGFQRTDSYSSCPGNRGLGVGNNGAPLNYIPLQEGETLVLLKVQVLVNQQYGLYETSFVPVKVHIVKCGD